MRTILLAIADPQTLVDVTQALGQGWEVTSAASEVDALGHLRNRAFDALLVDFNMGSPDASDLLNQALQTRTETNRFLLAYESDLALVAAKVEGTPQILPKPIEGASLKSRIEETITEPGSEQGGSEPVNDQSQSTAVPSVYSEVLKALESPGLNAQELGELIGRDPSLSSEMLKLTQSTCLGLPRNISDPVVAVESLGLETIRALVMALQFLAEHRHLNPGYLSFQQIWEHSVKVGQIARDLVLFETKDRALASQALAAGLLHDLGKVILVTNFDDLYGRVNSLARKQPVTIWDVEKEMFGANHGEIGACLVGMWNLPSAIVDATALHHEPPLGENQQLTPLAAVHIANVLEHQLRPGDQDMMVAPIISTPLLNELGLLQRLPVWRAALANRRPADFEQELESVETDGTESGLLSSTPLSRTTNHLQPPALATRTSTSETQKDAERPAQTQSAAYQRRLVYGGVVVLALALLALWLRTQPELDETAPVYARAIYQAPAAVTTTPAPEISPVAAPQTTPEAVVSEPAPAAPNPPVTAPEPHIALGSEPEVKQAPFTSVTATNTPSPVSKPPEKVAPDFRLSAIFYTSVRPSAIVNGETVTVGDQINGATVIGIGRTTVTLQNNGQRKTYHLR